MDIRLIAVQVGDALKNTTTVNEVDRIGAAVLKVARERFPNEAITTARAQGVYDGVLSIGKAQLGLGETEAQLIKFCREITRDEDWPAISKVLQDGGIAAGKLNRQEFNLFMGRGFHVEVIRHERKLYMDGHLFHAVFDVAKADNKAVREKAQRARRTGRP